MMTPPAPAALTYRNIIADYTKVVAPPLPAALCEASAIAVHRARRSLDDVEQN
jgi:hypothetical protein